MRDMKARSSGSADPRAEERSEEARHLDVTAIRFGCELPSSADRFDVGWINDRYFNCDMKVTAPVGCAFPRAARLRLT
jgi:hypothetical protein